MHIPRSDRNYTAEEFAALLDSAKARAEQARHDAQVAFWSDVSARLRRAWNRFISSPGAVFDRPVDPSWPHATR